MPIHYIKYDSIDKAKWDDCITHSPNGLIYGYSFYLDSMAANWDALVLNDYEAVMPLTWKKKFGIRYLYQPAFTQQLGIFSAKVLAIEIVNDFIEAAKKKFSFAEIYINVNNSTIAAHAHTNFILSLNSSYQDILAKYKIDLLKNLKHAEKFQHIYISTEGYNEAVDIYVKEYAARVPHVKNSDYKAFKNLCKILLKKEMLTVKKIMSPDNKLLAITLLLKDKKRLYNIMSTVLFEGRKSEANHFLFDQLIKEYAGKIGVLDFEGSDIKSIAFFYEKFGVVDQPYYFLRHNDLPWPLRYFKR